MKEEKFRIITIGRQLGCVGSQIGHEAAKRLGMECYDKRLIELACSYGEVDLERMQGVDEKMPNPFLYSVPREIQNEKTGRGIAVNDMMFNLQSEVIRRLAARESCIIIGRCADYVLRDVPGVTTIFLHGDMESRIKRVEEKRKLEKNQAVSLIKKTDKARRNYYECYTGKRWGARDSYDITLNTARLGLEKCVDLICRIYAGGEAELV